MREHKVFLLTANLPRDPHKWLNFLDEIFGEALGKLALGYGPARSYEGEGWDAEVKSVLEPEAKTVLEND